ncbi:MAG: helix-turn-helix transcriptional regulator [Clostridia bacterium]
MYTTDFTQVGRNIQSALSRRGLTQQNLADELGISKQVMSKIINGNKAINVNELARIAFILNATTDSLLTVADNTMPAPSFSFMGQIRNEQIRSKVETIKIAIDQILLLEELADEQ